MTEDAATTRADVEEEINAMADIAARLKPLPPASKQQVIARLADLYGAGTSEGRQLGTPDPRDDDDAGEVKGGIDGPEMPTFATLAELFNATKPRDEAEKALVGSFWAQELQGQRPITGFAVNKEVRHLGHKINIARGMTALQARDPALVIQLKKAGTSKQARKTYLVTDEGVAAVRAAVRQKSFKAVT